MSSNDPDLERLLAPPEPPQRRLSADEVHRFVDERVIHVAGSISDAWLDRLDAVVDARSTAVGWQSMEANLWLRDDAMHDVVMNCPVAHLAQQLLDALAPANDPEPRDTAKPVRFFYDQMFVKHPDTGQVQRHADDDGDLGNTPWHQDITFWPVRGEQIVSVWIALDATNLDNGGLEFVPGSATFGDRFQAIGVGNDGRIPFATDTLEKPPAINSATTGETDASLSAITFELERGDVLIFDANILHGAPPNRSDRPRRGLALRYLGSDVVLDNEKYGDRTVMAPFDVYDESLRNGSPARGPIYPQVLPTKVDTEVAFRRAGPIAPNKRLMAAWLQRNRTVTAAIRGAPTAS